MAFDLTTISDILKIDYQGPVRDQLNNATILLVRVRRSDENFIGKQAYIPLRKGRNVGRGARIESGTLPTAGNQQYDSAIFNVVYNYGRIQLTGPAISSAKTNAGAFVRAIDSEMRGLMMDLKTSINRQLWHDGSSVLTVCGTTSGSATVNVSSTKFLEVGLPFTIVNPSDGTIKESGDTVVAILSDTQFTSSTTVTTDTDDLLIEGAGSGSSSNSRNLASATTFKTTPLELWGLEAMISSINPARARADTADIGAGGFDQTLVTAQFGQIDRKTGNLFWDSGDLNNSGTTRDLTLDLMQQAFDETDIEADELPGLILTDHPIKRRYASLLVSDKRYPAGGEITLDGGYRALEFNGVPLVADRDASLTRTPGVLNRLYFLTESALEFEVLEDWKWMERDGAVLSRVSNVDAYEATMFSYFQFATDHAKAHCLLDDINES
jgi:hypothetical protein